MAMSQEDERKMMQMMEEMQMKHFFKSFNSIVDRCFNACTYNFRTPKLDAKEEQCVTRCVDKFTNYSARVQYIFAEQNLMPQTQSEQPAAGTPESSQ